MPVDAVLACAGVAVFIDVSTAGDVALLLVPAASAASGSVTVNGIYASCSGA